jgi:lysophospholipase L1-like esterase
MRFNGRKMIATIVTTIVLVSMMTIGCIQVTSRMEESGQSQNQVSTPVSSRESGQAETNATMNSSKTSSGTSVSIKASSVYSTPVNSATTKATTKTTTKTATTTTKVTTKTTTKSTTSATTKATTKATSAPTTTSPLLKYEGQAWYAIGDSITVQDQYTADLSQLMKFSSYVIDARNGQQMATMADWVTEENLASIKLVTVFGGTNDYGYNIPLGKINDSSETYTFYGNLQYVINRIRNANPTVEIIFMTPIVRGNKADLPFYPVPNDAGYYLEQYVQAIKDVCSRNSIRVIDLYNKSGINEDNLSIYTIDYLHPNEAGAQKIADAIYRELGK